MIKIISNNLIFIRQIESCIEQIKATNNYYRKSEEDELIQSITDINKGVYTYERGDIFISDKPIRLNNSYAPLFIISKSPIDIDSISADVHYYKWGSLGTQFVEDLIATIDKQRRDYEESASADDYRGKNEQLNNKLTQYHKYFKEAGDMQTKIMENVSVAGYDSFAYYQPLRTVSADVLFSKTIGDKTYFMIADITDHGLSQGIYATSIYTLAAAFFTLVPQAYLNLEGWVYYMASNCDLYSPGRRYTNGAFTATFVEISENKAKFIACGSGCELPIIIHDNVANKRGFSIEQLAMEKSIKDKPWEGTLDEDAATKIHIYPPIAVNTAKRVPGYQPLEIKLKPRDGIFFFSDGITELFNENKKEKSVDKEYSMRLKTTIENEIMANHDWTPKELINSVIRDADAYSGVTFAGTVEDAHRRIPDAEDDVTLFCIRMKGKNEG